MNIQQMNIYKLQYDNAVSLHGQHADKRAERAKIEEQAKALIESNPAPAFDVNPSAIPPKLTVHAGELEPFSFIDDIDELSKEEKRTLQQLIRDSVSKTSASQGSFHQMQGAQGVMQLQVIADKLIPAQYKDQMHEAINAYAHSRQSTERELARLLNERIEEFVAKFPEMRSGGPSSLENFERVASATKTFYEGMDFSTPANFIASFEKALADYGALEKDVYDLPDEQLQAFQGQLRDKWNQFAQKMDELKAYRLPTSEQSRYDFSL